MTGNSEPMPPDCPDPVTIPRSADDLLRFEGTQEIPNAVDRLIQVVWNFNKTADDSIVSKSIFNWRKLSRIDDTDPYLHIPPLPEHSSSQSLGVICPAGPVWHGSLH
jgi:hypothetical protein